MTSQASGMVLDGCSLSRHAKRDALYRIQDGRCAICGVIGKPFTERGRNGKLVADHDHDTGILRGLLCWKCNQREGKVRSGLFRMTDPAIEAYLAAPPAAGFGWMWDLPDEWCTDCTAAVYRTGCTILEYVTSDAYREHVAERTGRLNTAVLDAMLSSQWGRDDGTAPG